MKRTAGTNQKMHCGAMAASFAAAAAVGLWAAIHVIPGFGPVLADSGRKVVGPAPVAWAEDVVYGLEDRAKRVVYHGAAPKTPWEPAAEGDEHSSIATNPAVASTFAPAPFTPPFAAVAAQGDGQWVAIADAGQPNEPTRLFKTSVHPDPKRSYAVVAVVAMDLARVSLNLVAGAVEPASEAVPNEARLATVPADQWNSIVAAFNGGFKAEHGHYGMMTAGRSFLPPKESSCTVALYHDGTLRVGTWKGLAESQPSMTAFRQTPPCLVEQGDINAILVANDEAPGWGVGPTTAIRRSAIGLDQERQTLLFAIGDSVTAGTLARALQAAGAVDAAQLDVNAAFPRFLVYGNAKPNEPPKVVSSLMPDSPHVAKQYVATREARDFFFVTRKTL